MADGMAMLTGASLRLSKHRHCTHGGSEAARRHASLICSAGETGAIGHINNSIAIINTPNVKPLRLEPETEMAMATLMSGTAFAVLGLKAMTHEWLALTG